MSHCPSRGYSGEKEWTVIGYATEYDELVEKRKKILLNDADRAKQTKPYLGVEVATYSLLSPWLEIELCSSLFLWVPYHISHGLDETGR